MKSKNKQKTYKIKNNINNINKKKANLKMDSNKKKINFGQNQENR